MESSANNRQELGAENGVVQAFAGFVLDRNRKVLLRAGEQVPLKPKVYDLLCLLIDHRERVLSHAELMDALWPRQDIEESNLGKMVYELRRALDDPALIQNLPRRGYRFTGEVSLAATNNVVDTIPSREAEVRPSSRRLVAMIGAVLVLAAVVLLSWLGPAREDVELAAAPSISFSPTRIAVLPFEDFSPEGNQQFLGDGLADTLLRTLAGVEELSVIARGSAFPYRGRDIATVARELEVGSVVEGSVQRSGDALRIVVQLVNTSDQRQVWSQSFDRKPDDIFAIQDEIAGQVLETLMGAETIGLERPRLARTSTEAYDFYLRGRELWQQRERATIIEAVELLEQAVALDPEFAPARSELATALYFAGLVRGESLPRMDVEIERALALAPNDAQAHALRGHLLSNQGHVGEARVALERALALRPNDVNFIGWLGISYASAGMMNTAARHYRRAIELDSMNPLPRVQLVTVLQFLDPAEAIALARQAARLFPESHMPWAWLVNAYEVQGKHEAAVLAAVDALEHVAEPDWFLVPLARGFSRLGELDLADRWRKAVPGRGSNVGWKYEWLMARGDVHGAVEMVREAMARQGDPATLGVSYGRALIDAGEYDEAWLVLKQVLAARPDLADPGSVSWSQSEALVWLAGLARRRGDQARAEEFEAAALRTIEFVAAESPWYATERSFLLELAMGRYESAAALMTEQGARPGPLTLHRVEHSDWWRPLGDTQPGRMALDELQQDLSRQLERLRASGIPWLLEPEQWPGR